MTIEIPQAAIEAAVAAFDHPAVTSSDALDLIYDVLAAALPSIVAAVRASVADEIQAAADQRKALRAKSLSDNGWDGPIGAGMRLAANVAAGGATPEP